MINDNDSKVHRFIESLVELALDTCFRMRPTHRNDSFVEQLSIHMIFVL